MRNIKIESFKDLIYQITDLNKDDKINSNFNLFRGQSKNFPLLPSIARQTNGDTTEVERIMLDEFIRRTKFNLNTSYENEWDKLILAQHFGLKTRLLDWSTNPLVATWFACSNLSDNDSFVYILTNCEELIIDKETDPFEIDDLRIIVPSLNNERIIAQSGWFTAHPYASNKFKFESLEECEKISERLIEIEIPKNLKVKVVEELNLLGINSTKIYPDTTGVCNHINWVYSRILEKNKVGLGMDVGVTMFPQSLLENFEYKGYADMDETLFKKLQEIKKNKRTGKDSGDMKRMFS